ncbi:MAG: MBL fold metallo-hydrolase [Methanomassiliicoccales archaeon]
MRSTRNGALEVHILASSSDANCTVLASDDAAIMIDAGLSIRKTEHFLNTVGVDIFDINALLLTHEHVDHSRSALRISRRCNIPIAGNYRTLLSTGIHGMDKTVVFENREPFYIGMMKIEAIPTSHNAAEPVAYHVEANNKDMVIATDLGKVTKPVLSAMTNADFIMLESNHDRNMLLSGPYPLFLKRMIMSEKGHLSNHDCAQALKTIDVKKRKIFLAHLSQINNTPEIAKNTVSNALRRNHYIDCIETPGEIRSIIVD